MKNGFAVVTSLLGGALIGTAIGMLCAPEAGERQRRKLRVMLKKAQKMGGEKWEQVVADVKEACKKRGVDVEDVVEDIAADYDVE